MTYHIIAISNATTYPDFDVIGTLVDAKAAADTRYDDGFQDVWLDIRDADYRLVTSRAVSGKWD